MQSKNTFEALEPRNIQEKPPQISGNLRLLPRLVTWGFIGIVSMSPLRILRFFEFLTSPVPQDPSKGSPPQKKPGHFRNRTKTLVMGHQRNCLDAPIKKFEFLFIFGLSSHPRTPPKGPGTPPSRKKPRSILELIQNPWLWCVNGIVLTCPTFF